MSDAGATLALDASTYVGTVAVIVGGEVVAEREAAMRGEREERLMPAVVAALREAAVPADSIARVVCGAGPGSFTSLRIAGSIAKGLALASGAELVPVSSLLLIVAAARPALAPGRYVAALDAMRGELFAAAFEVGDAGAIAQTGEAVRVDGAALGRLARELRAETIGPGQDVDAQPHARGAALLGARIGLPAPADLESWEPTYGRLAEAQVRWEAAHGRPLSAG